MRERSEDLTRRLEACLAILRDFDRQSESGFLKLGETVRGVAGLSRRLAECAAELAADGGVGRYRRAIAGFEELVEELREIREGTREHGAVLERIAGLVRAFRGPAREFARANRTFRLLGLYVRVEASRLREAGGEFASLADDITSLASGIDESAGRLEEDSRRAAEALAGGWTRMRELDRKQWAENCEMLDLAAQEIAVLSRQAAAMDEAAKALAEGCGRLRDEISRVVTGLQFQDIARQRLEHVCEGLERVLRGLRQAGDEAGAAALAALEARQLDSAREELRAALVRIGESLRTAGAQAARFGAEAGRLGEERGELKVSGGKMTGTAEMCSASLGRLAQVVAEVMPVLDGMGDSAARIDETGYRIGLVSLNGAVKTAALGEEGVALGVVAAEMGRLAMETGLQAESVAGRLEELRRETAVLTQLGASRDGSRLMERVEETLKRAAEADGEREARLLAVRQWTGKLAEALCGGEEREEWARRLVARLEEAGGLAREVADELAGNDGVEGGTAGNWSEGMEGRYTMASEREIHEEYLLGVALQENRVTANPDETFGDGIELF